MYLRDLQLDVPHPYNERIQIINNIMRDRNCTYEQAILIDYDTNWKWNIRRRFLLESNCIVAMFLRLLGKYKNDDCKKILVRCVKDVVRQDGFNALGIYTIELKVNYVKFFEKDDYDKKLITLNIIKQSIAKVVQEKGWDTSPFESVFNRIMELNYNNCWTCGKKVKSQNKLYTAEVYLEHEVKQIDIYIIIRNNQGEIVKKELIITEQPHEYAYVKLLGKLVWSSNNQVQLVSRNNDRQWNVEFTE